MTLLETVADAIDAARYAHPEHPRERPRPFGEADRSDKEYATRLARAALAAAFDGLEKECWSLKCESYSNGDAGDAEVGWEVISHHMAYPKERLEGQGGTPILAIEDAYSRVDQQSAGGNENGR